MQLTKFRSDEKEIMDFPDNFSDKELSYMYKEINIINKYLLGDYFILKCLKDMAIKSKLNSITILDLGCGNGDLLIKARNAIQKYKIEVECVGFDPYIDLTDIQKAKEEGVIIYTDWQELITNHSIDISTTSLTLHHLYDEELDLALTRLFSTPKIGYVISDLMRNIVAYYSIKFLVNMFSKSKIVKNDAPLSVLRGFSRIEMEQFKVKSDTFALSSLTGNIAFRWMLVGFKAK
jgi:SAM-dependent methyltransferase